MWSSKKSKKNNQSHQPQHTRSKSYRDIGFKDGNEIVDIDSLTEGNPMHDSRVLGLSREIKQLKQKVEAQAEYTRQLEEDKNKLQSKLESYISRCNDLQSNLDDKDKHLSDVVEQLSSSYASSSRPKNISHRKQDKKGWFGWGSQKSSTPKGLSSSSQSKRNSNLFHTPQHTPQKHNGLESIHSSIMPISYPNTFASPPTDNNNINVSPLNTNNTEDDTDYIGNLPSNSEINNINLNLNSNNNTLPCMTAPITRPRRSGSVHIMHNTGGGMNEEGVGNNISNSGWNGSTYNNSLLGSTPHEMEFKIKNASSSKLRSYIQDLFYSYQNLDLEKKSLFSDLAKAVHEKGWIDKQALKKEKQAKSALEKESNAQQHIRSLEKSIKHERKKVDKFRIKFEEFKSTAIRNRKELLIGSKKLNGIISQKDEFIERACYKLMIYKDRLSQFEIPVFKEFVILIAPAKDLLLKYENGQIDGSNNLNVLHENMVHQQTPGGPGFNPNLNPQQQTINEDGGTVTSIASVASAASVDSTYSVDGPKRHKKSSNSSKASSGAHDTNTANLYIGEEKELEEHDYDLEHKNKKEHIKKREKDKKYKKKKNKRKLSNINGMDDDHKQNETKLNAKNRKSKAKSKPKSLSNLSAALNKKSSKSKRRKQKSNKKNNELGHNKKKKKDNKKDILDTQDMLEMDLDDMVSSSSSEEEFILMTDSDEHQQLNNNNEYDNEYNDNTMNQSYHQTPGNLSDYVQLTLVKYPGTGELFLIIIGSNKQKDQIELFRVDFALCLNIERSNKIQTDFRIYFDNLCIIFRGDDFEKTNKMLIILRQFFETHCSNIQPELPPPPETTVTNQMNLFFGGF